MLFFKRYLEKSQLTAKQFESSQIPCYFKMRELAAPQRIDHYRDLLLECSALRFLPYTEDWIVIEYFADHDSDYLVSFQKTPIDPIQHLPKNQLFQYCAGASCSLFFLFCFLPQQYTRIFYS